MFTCLTPGHYTISYTASAGNWGDGLVRVHQIYLYLNGEQVADMSLYSYSDSVLWYTIQNTLRNAENVPGISPK